MKPIRQLDDVLQEVEECFCSARSTKEEILRLSRVKLHSVGTANRRISNVEGRKRFAKSFLKQTKYIHSKFDVGRSKFDVHQFLF